MTGGLRKFKTQSEATTNRSGAPPNHHHKEESVRGMLQAANIMIEEDSFAASLIENDIEE